MNHMTYLMRDQVRDLVPSLDTSALTNRKPRDWKKLRPYVEISAFVLAVMAYIAALSLLA